MSSNWNQLPLEVKYIVLRHMTRNTRLALSACSTNDKELVSSIRFKTVECFRMYCDDLWCNIGWSEGDDNFTDRKFSGIESLQNDVQDLLREYHFINRLEMRLADSKIQLLKDETARKLKVKELHVILKNSEGIKNIVEQVEPLYLEKIYFTLEEPDEAIFDTPQVMLAEEVRVDGRSNSGIRENQLMKLSARVVKIDHIQFPVNEYIKKCISQADSNIARFMFTFDDETLIEKSFESLEYTEEKLETLYGSECVRIIDTPNPNLKLKVKIDRSDSPVTMSGSIDFDSERSSSLYSADESMFKVIQSLEVSSDCMFRDRTFKIKITRRHQPERVYDFRSAEETKAKLDDILANTDYIKSFEINISNNEYDWKFQPRDKLLIVGKLEVTSEDQVFDEEQSLFEVIDAEQLKKLIIEAEAISPECFSIPHVINTPVVKFYQSDLSGYQQMRMNTRRYLNLVVPHLIDDETEEWHEYLPITDTDLNQYFKRCLLKLNEKDFDFLFTYNSEGEEIFEEEQLFEGLDIISSEWDGEWKVITIKSNFENYVYKVELYEGEIKARRALKV